MPLVTILFLALGAGIAAHLALPSLLKAQARTPDWTNWQVVGSNPLVQVRWDRRPRDNFRIPYIEFKTDKDVTVEYLATVLKNVIAGGTPRRETETVRRSVRVSTIGGARASELEWLAIQNVAVLGTK